MTPGDPGSSLPEGGITNMPPWLQSQVDNRDRLEEGRRGSRADWTEGQWQRAMQNALRPEARHGQNAGEWEYLVQGDWVNQQTYDDPLWRQNVYDPWAQGVRDEWSVAREKADKWKKEHKGANPWESFTDRPGGRSGGFRRGPTQRSSSRGGGGGGGFDPSMLDQLMRGA